MSTDTSIYFVPVGTVEREDTTNYTVEWLEMVVDQPHYLQQHNHPQDAKILHHARLFDLAEAFCPNQRWQNILGYINTDLRNLSGLVIDESVIEQALALYAVVTLFVSDPDTDLKELERLLEEHKGQEFYIWC